MLMHPCHKTMAKICLDTSKFVSLLYTFLLVLGYSTQASAQIIDVKLDFSEKRGFYDAPFNLTITATDPSATIRYTLDGKEPTPRSGIIYNGSIPVETTTVLRAIGYIPGVDTSKLYTHSYLYIEDVINQPRNISGWPNNRYDLGGSGTATHDYQMDPDIVNSSRYRADLIQGMMDIPSMSIVMPRGDFWEIYDGEVERKMSVELLYPEDPSLNEQEDGGIEPHSHHRLKRSMRLSFKERYGAKDWDSDIFRNAAVGSETAENEFDRIVLRAGNNRAWSRNWNEDRTAFTRDEWFRQSQIAASGIGSHGTFVHLYVNGLYWGLYNPIERPDESFTSTYLGGDKDDWFAVSHAGIRSGNRNRYNYLINDLLDKNLNNQSNYNELKEYLDVEQFLDYILLSWMTGVQDWPGNNWWAGNSNSPTGPLMFFGWDNEWSWDVTRNANNGAWVHPDFRSNDTGGRNSALVFNKAKRSDEFMMTLADRVYDICFNDGAVTDENSRERWAALNNQIENAVVAESARWGDSLNDGETRNRDQHWRNEVNRVDGLMDGNVDRLITALRREGYYPSINPPLFLNRNRAVEVKDLSVESGYRVDMENPNNSGDIYFTTNGEDPRLPGGGISSSAQEYTNRSLVMNQSTTLMARVKQGNDWSALHTLQLGVRQDLSWIKLTEIMYNPEEFAFNRDTIEDTELEFLEIKNTSNSLTLDISGLQITDGVEFTFPIGTIMEPQSFVVIASNPSALAQKCPGFNIIGEYSGQLSNGGEKIEFTTFDGEVIICVEYDDKDLWPTEADGEGFSLVSTDTNPTGDQNSYAYWTTSTDNVCGSPNADDTTTGGGTGNIDCDQNYSFNAIDDSSELSVNGFSPAYVDNARGAIAINAAMYKDEFAAVTIPFNGQSGTYNLELFTMAESDGESSYRIAINGQRLSGTFTNPRIFGTGIAEFTQYSNVWTNVSLQSGDVIRVEFNSASNGMIPEGTDFAFSRGRWTALELQCTVIDNGCTTIGQACNDGDPCTTRDRYDADCNCIGTFADADGDGVCDADDNCDGSLAGQSCNDRDECTTNDVYNSDCECAGTYVDEDQDGICDPMDDCVFGSSIIDENFQNGLGDFSELSGAFSTPKPTYENLIIHNRSIELQVGGVNRTDITDMSLAIATDFDVTRQEPLRLEIEYRLTSHSGFDAGEWTRVLAEVDGNNLSFDGNPYLAESNAGNITDTGIQTAEFALSNLSAGRHTLSIGLLVNKKTTTNERSELRILSVRLSGNCSDCDLTGTRCNDGDACTTGDVYDADCNCVGQFQDSDNDGICDANDSCDGSQIGRACDDGDDCTTGDVYDSDCNCVGTFRDSDNDGICDANDNCDVSQIGRACDDGDACTTGDVYDADCNCAGMYIDVDGDGICGAQDPDDSDGCVPNATGAECNSSQDCSVISTTGFENRDMGIWIDGGQSATVLSGSFFANTGNNSFYIQANDGIQSSLYTSDLNLEGVEAVQIKFNVFPYAVEDTDSFVLEVSTGGAYVVINEYVNNVDFSNQVRQDITEVITGINFTATTSLRLRSTADDIADYFIFDDIVIEACQGGSTPACEPGSVCDDGDICTTGDVYDADCNCAGVFTDADGDGVCDEQDVCPSMNDALIGTPCNDGNDNTTGDVFTSNCDCVGEAVAINGIECTSTTNVALGKTTTQVSTFRSNETRFGSANAIDGNTDGDHRNNSITRTVSQQNAWWEVDLGQVYNLEFVRIWNRTSCCGERLKDFHVLVSDVAFNSTDLNNAINQNGVGDFHFPGTAGEETDMELNRTGRYLRIQLLGMNSLQLAEVEVMGCSSGNSSDCQAISEVNFESGFNIWNDGGSDCGLIINSAFSNSGSSSVRLRDNSGAASSMFTDNLNMSAASEAVISFSFLPESFETGEDFFFEVSTNGGSSFAIVQEWVVNEDFSNGQRQHAQVNIGSNNLSNNTVFRIRCDASGNADLLYIDDVMIESCSGSGLVNPSFQGALTTNMDNNLELTLRAMDSKVNDNDLGSITIAPNPASDFISLNLSHCMEKSISYQIYGIKGEVIQSGNFDANHSDIEKINLLQVSNGTYILQLRNDSQHLAVHRIVVAK